jgi:hypothetical protein
MKSSSRSAVVRISLFIVSLSICLFAVANTEARDESLLSPGPVRPGGLLHDRPVPAQGSLVVYSATDEFDDGGVPYHAHSSYTIYTTTGKLVKNVENHISRSDEIPEIVALPVGSYVVDARSERDGYIRRSVVIKAGRQTILDLDSRDKELPGRIAHN